MTVNATEPRRRWWPRSVRAGAALAAALTAAAILAGIGWWVHHDVYRQSTQIAEDQAKAQLWALCDQLRQGVIPDSTSTVPYEVVATGRRTAVAYGGGMDDFDPGTHHVMPAPPKARRVELITTVRLPLNPDYDPVTNSP
ncbi:hypothetical protein AB0H26_47155 [Streptomyces milbemycinicus]